MPIIGKDATQLMEDDLRKHARGLYRLGMSHLRFAKSIRPKEWRQIVSRSYYAAYNISRAVRLLSKGEYSDDSKDHQSFGQLPSDFESQPMYINKLALLRDDRNICDYDHVAKHKDLSIAAPDALTLAVSFAKDAAKYLTDRNLVI